MLRCVKCRAPIEYSDNECWHCQVTLKDHPSRNDIRYWLAFGRVPRYVFNLFACIVCVDVVIATFELITETPTTGNPWRMLCLSVVLLIACLRLIL